MGDRAPSGIGTALVFILYLAKSLWLLPVGIFKRNLISPTNSESQAYIYLTGEVSWWVQDKPLNNTTVDENIEQPPTPKK